ncbi:conserved membrane hypothetical protein [uncultured Eubacteriales bacterium]|uniref:TIGR02206 family membrane protein n=1 Tax=uncultured Eubacteriales bacterium TaxID=172733 RepID=A0A212J0X5_9FIRM|nr:conserved membrane hypothetical protein [uncultured Eubacteriales bacterium]
MDLRAFWLTTGKLRPFGLFKLPHLTALGIFALICLGIILWKEKLREPKADRMCRIIMFFVLASQQALYYIWSLKSGMSLVNILPLHICGFSVFLCLIALVNQDAKLFSIIYFFAFSGTLQAILTPSMDGYNFPHFRFFQFFAGHILIITVALYFKVVKGFKIKFLSLLQAFVVLNILAAAAFAANIMSGTNYMFLLHKPDSFSLLSVLAPWPYYLIELELLGFIVFLLIYATTNIKSLVSFLHRFWKRPWVSPKQDIKGGV